MKRTYLVPAFFIVEANDKLAAEFAAGKVATHLNQGLQLAARSVRSLRLDEGIDTMLFAPKDGENNEPQSLLDGDPIPKNGGG